MSFFSFLHNTSANQKAGRYWNLIKTRHALSKLDWDLGSLIWRFCNYRNTATKFHCYWYCYEDDDGLLGEKRDTSRRCSCSSYSFFFFTGHILFCLDIIIKCKYRNHPLNWWRCGVITFHIWQRSEIICCANVICNARRINTKYKVGLELLNKKNIFEFCPEAETYAPLWVSPLLVILVSTKCSAFGLFSW